MNGPFHLLKTNELAQNSLLLYLSSSDYYLGQGLPQQQQAQNPFAAAAAVGGQVAVTKSKPVVRTETVYATSTIPLFLGAKKFFTTLTQSIGMTTITDYKTETVAPGILVFFSAERF